MKSILNKKYITGILLSLFVGIALFLPFSISAQQIAEPADPSAAGSSEQQAPTQQEEVGPPPPQQTPTNPTNPGSTPAGGKKVDEECDFTSFFSLGCIQAVVERVVAFSASLAMLITSWLLWASGALLKLVMDYTVVNMASNLDKIGAIDIAWKVFRDLANMFFIFIILWIAIATILDLGGINTRKMLVNVVIIALLLNFSLFFTKIIIDASNIVTIGFYNRITNDSAGTEGLAGPFIQSMGIQGVFDVNGIIGEGQLLQSGTPLTRIFLIGSLSSVFFLVTAFVFLAANLMLIGRFVILIFLMILSPLAFVAMALPKDKWSSQWWGALFDQCLFLPAFIALMYATLLILKGVTKSLQIDPKDWTTAFLGGADGLPTAGGVAILLNFLIIIVMMVACLIIAKQFGAHGSGWAMKKITKAKEWSQGKLGRGAVRASGLAALDRRFADSTFGKSKIGRGIRSMTTAPITNADFGSGQSIQKVDKAVKKLDEDYAKAQEKKVTSKFDKNINTLREDELRGRMLKEAPQMVGKDGKVREKAEVLLRIEADTAEKDFRDKVARGEVMSAQQVKEGEKLMRELEDKVRRGEVQGNQRTAAEQSIKETREAINKSVTAQKKIDDKRELASYTEKAQQRIKENPVASNEEKAKWLRPALKEQAEWLDRGGMPKIIAGSMPMRVMDNLLRMGDRSAAVKLLREKSRGGGKKQVDEIVKEALQANGEVSDGDGEASEKKA